MILHIFKVQSYYILEFEHYSKLSVVERNIKINQISAFIVYCCPGQSKNTIGLRLSIDDIYVFQNHIHQ